MTHDERHKLIDDLFEVLEATGAKTLTELSQAKGVMKSVVKKLSEYDKPRRKRIMRLIARFVAAQVETAAPETELLNKMDKLDQFTKGGKFDVKKALSMLEWEDK